MSKFELFIYNIYSFIICLKLFPIKEALRRPVLIHPKVRIKGLHKGCISLANSKARLVFGFKGMEGQSNCQSILSFGKDSLLVLHGFATMAKGTRLVLEKGRIEIGNNFFCNGDCFIRCNCKINFYKDVLIGWIVTFNTTNGHQTFYQGKHNIKDGDINIGNHVWIASNSIVAKGVIIPDNCVVGQSSLVLKPFLESNCLIAGVPAHIIKRDCIWKA